MRADRILTRQPQGAADELGAGRDERATAVTGMAWTITRPIEDSPKTGETPD
jgi:hypothetical protein